MIQNFIFVCTGNICRSCLAEVIARDLSGNGSQLTFSSMGTNALVGNKADQKAIDVAAENGVDLSKHIARQLNIQELTNAEHIFCMDRSHLQFVKSLSPMIAEKTTLLTDYPKPRIFKKDVDDPYRKSISKFRKSRDLITKELKKIIPLLQS